MLFRSALLSEVITPGPATAGADEVSEIRRIAVQTIESLRDLVWFLDPANDDMDDLLLRMKETARAMLPRIPFEFRAFGESGPGKPSLELRRNLFPIFKEILHNIAKHSGATLVEIAVENTPRSFQLRVCDNGKGFDAAAPHSGNGLKNLRRRAADIRGTIEIDSQPATGTTITIRAPLA